MDDATTLSHLTFSTLLDMDDSSNFEVDGDASIFTSTDGSSFTSTFSFGMGSTSVSPAMKSVVSGLIEARSTSELSDFRPSLDGVKYITGVLDNLCCI